MSPRVLTIVLNWNSAAESLACLASLERLTYENVHLLGVDNGSIDDSLTRIRTHAPHIDVLESKRNLGYAGGNNRGIEWGLTRGFDYFWIVNPDVVVDPESLSALVRVADTEPQVGLVGPLIYCTERPRCVLSAGGVFRNGRTRHRGVGELDTGQFAAVAEVDWLSGCALLASRRLIESVGLLDERFFLYGEDVEWCYRARRAGFRVLLAPRAKIWHPDTRRRDELSARVTYYIARNQVLLMRTHHLGARVAVAFLLRHLRTLASWSVRPKWRHKRAQRRALLRALLDAARGRWGAAEGL